MTTWRIFERLMILDAERQFRIFIIKILTIGFVIGFIMGMLIAYGIR